MRPTSVMSIIISVILLSATPPLVTFEMTYESLPPSERYRLSSVRAKWRLVADDSNRCILAPGGHAAVRRAAHEEPDPMAADGDI